MVVFVPARGEPHRRDTAAILDATAIPFAVTGVAPDHGRPYAGSSIPIPAYCGSDSCPTTTASRPIRTARGPTRRTADLLADLGHEVVESRPEAFLHLGDLQEMAWAFTVNWSATAVVSLVTLGEQLGRTVTADDVDPGKPWAMAELGRGYTAPDYIRSQGILGGWRRSMASWWEL
ncbi:MAG: hypothetical protein Ct9H300mP12_02460 [Acidimicrobiales bacterium]|nr:MAG: hypothetical protein Ct9H300mP12_02460 [Acidimicrobiales bacterium]